MTLTELGASFGRSDLLRELGAYDPDASLLDGTRVGDYRRDVLMRHEPLGEPTVVRRSVPYLGGISVSESISPIDQVVVAEARRHGREIVAAAGTVFFKDKE